VIGDDSHRPAPPRLRARTGLVLLALGAAMFGVLAADLMGGGAITGADAGISAWLHQRTHPALTPVLVVVTQLHSTAGVYFMAGLAALWLVWNKQLSWLPLLLLSVPGGLALNALVKQVFQRARPSFDSPLPSLVSYSFPSGHTAGATVFWGFALILLLAHRPPLRWRIAGVVVALAMVLLTALSRVYLGVHYLSDVLAAMAEGVAWLAVCLTVHGRLSSRRAAVPG
jgi:membrane-associated phospholipid phosphatase